MGPESQIGVVLILKHPVLRASLKTLVQQESDLDIIYESDGSASDPGQSIPQKACVVLVESETQILIREHLPQLAQYPILVLSVQDDWFHLKSAFQEGARGYLPQPDAANEVLTAIRALARGHCYVGQSVDQPLPEDFGIANT